MKPLVRPFEPDDASDVTVAWFEGWHDAHAAFLPEALVSTRGLEAFQKAAPRLAAPVDVAEVEGRVVGFAQVNGQELEKLFLARHARGTGVAQALMASAEQRIRSEGFVEGILDYVRGNARAARFYEKSDWRIVREEEDEIELPDGSTAQFHSIICHKAL
ncbi:MAG: GNAT family N-acetyltransferase [Pseudomonadota bacterium]